MERLTPQSPVSMLAGIGKSRAEAFARMGIFTVRDLLYLLPRSYENRGDIRLLGDLPTEGPAAFRLTVATAPKSVSIKRGKTLTKFYAFDESGRIEIVFFNQAYCDKIFAVGDEYRFFGRLTPQKRSFQLINPAYEPIREGEALPDLVSVYPLTEGLSRNIILKAIGSALSVLPQIEDPLPEGIRQKNSFPTLATALYTLHFPEGQAALSSALSRVIFDELFAFSLGIALTKQRRSGVPAVPCPYQNVSPLLSLLPYTLTDSQKEAVRQIAADMKGDKGAPMARILVGDVGCGKTVCAALAMYIAILNGHQAALMAPTEILARQHYKDLQPLFERLSIRCELLIGATPKKEKERIREALLSEKQGRCDIVIGTHALLSESVGFADLALTVTDEQHRFGAGQRATLKEKNEEAHLLVMSATPIPRTLALMLYGDLDVSRITELPKGRQRVDTFFIGESKRDRLNGFIEKQVSEGGQVYIVCPAIEESEDESLPLESFLSFAEKEEKPPLKGAIEYAEKLIGIFPTLRIAYLHGKMKSTEKDAIMHRFSEGEIDILVSTTVIEVGVNVPNASLMIVENAERFGLSQLHQLRGRVGRGEKKSYCVLVSDSKGDAAKRRLSALCKTNDGYEIAEEDLALRGPGDFFAASYGDTLRQSGGMGLPLASLCKDNRLIELASFEARALLAEDPTLSLPDNRAALSEVNRLFAINQNTFS